MRQTDLQKSSQLNCDYQEHLYNQNNKEDEIFVLNGRYRVEIGFENEMEFPTKYYEYKHFENVPLEEEQQVIDEIIDHYLGDDFSNNQPEIMNVYNDIVNISVYVSSSDELTRFVDDERVKGISHLGNTSIEEGN